MHPEKIYLMRFDDAVGSGVRDMLQSLGAVVITDTANTTFDHFPAYAYKQPVVVIIADEASGEGEFARGSRYTRYMSLADTLKRGFTVPPEITRFLNRQDASVLAVKKCACAAHMREGLRDALTRAHYRDQRTGAWLGKKVKRKRQSRLARLLERRHERRLQYALP